MVGIGLVKQTKKSEKKKRNLNLHKKLYAIFYSLKKGILVYEGFLEGANNEGDVFFAEVVV